MPRAGGGILRGCWSCPSPSTCWGWEGAIRPRSSWSDWPRLASSHQTTWIRYRASRVKSRSGQKKKRAESGRIKAGFFQYFSKGLLWLPNYLCSPLLPFCKTVLDCSMLQNPWHFNLDTVVVLCPGSVPAGVPGHVPLHCCCSVSRLCSCWCSWPCSFTLLLFCVQALFQLVFLAMFLYTVLVLCLGSVPAGVPGHVPLHCCCSVSRLCSSWCSWPCSFTLFLFCV